MTKQVKLRCRKCGTEFTDSVPEPVILNSATVSVVGISPKKISCPNPNCLAIMVPIIANANLQFQWVETKDKPQSDLIIPVGIS